MITVKNIYLSKMNINHTLLLKVIQCTLVKFSNIYKYVCIDVILFDLTLRM